jgi:hypothetical protein
MLKIYEHIFYYIRINVAFKNVVFLKGNKHKYIFQFIFKYIFFFMQLQLIIDMPYEVVGRLRQRKHASASHGISKNCDVNMLRKQLYKKLIMQSFLQGNI